jgi:hypothetical protein
MTATRLPVWEMLPSALSQRSAAGSSPIVASHGQVPGQCKAETGNRHKRRSSEQAYPSGALRYKGHGENG